MFWTLTVKYVNLHMKTYSTPYPNVYTFDGGLRSVVKPHIAYIDMIMLMDLKCFALTLQRQNHKPHLSISITTTECMRRGPVLA